MRRQSFVSLTGPSSPGVRRRPRSPSCPQPLPLSRPGPCRLQSRFGLYQRLSVSATLACSDVMSAWAVDSADDSDGDDGVDVLIIPGMDLSL